MRVIQLDGGTMTPARFRQLDTVANLDGIELHGRVNLPGKRSADVVHGVGTRTTTGDPVHIVATLGAWPSGWTLARYEAAPSTRAHAAVTAAPLLTLGKFDAA